MSARVPIGIRTAGRIAPLLFAAALSPRAAAQSVQTVVGGGPIGDGKPATAAILKVPSEVAVDAAGNLYIADPTSRRVRRVDAATGLMSTYAGGGTSGLGDGWLATAAEVNTPVGVTFDAAGNLVIADAGSARVRRVSRSTGVITTIAGGGTPDDGLGDGGPATAARLNPNDVAVDAAGNLYVAEPFEFRVRKVAAATGLITTVAGTGKAGYSGDGGPATKAALDLTGSLAVDAAGNLYLADRNNSRVRRVDAATGVITTVAGNGDQGVAGDGGPATLAAVQWPTGLSFDTAGNLFVTQPEMCRVRKVDGKTGVITTFAGTEGNGGFAGDGGPATQARLSFPGGTFVDAAGNLFLADGGNGRVRRVAGATGIIATVAGGGPSGDGGPAVSAQLFLPRGVALDAAGNLYVSEEMSHRIRKVSAETGLISTYAGNGEERDSLDAAPATAAGLPQPWGIAVSRTGDLYVISRRALVRKVDGTTGIMSVVAGGGRLEDGLGDGGPATKAYVSQGQGVALDGAGNLYIADTCNHRIRRVDAATGIITTVAGTGPLPGCGSWGTGTFSGDGGPATAAGLNDPIGVAVDREGTRLYFTDSSNRRIRKVDLTTGIISTVAGDGPGVEDGGPATQARLEGPTGVALDAAGSLFFATAGPMLVYRLDFPAGTIRRVAGSGGSFAITGDGGPATQASLAFPSGVAVGPDGSFFVADCENHRVRAVYACVAVAAPQLLSPADGATDLPTAPTLTWSAVQGAFRYDLVLTASTSPPRKRVIPDLTTTSYAPSNLLPLTGYTWHVVAKGDPFCPSVSTATSSSRTFRTGGVCIPPGAFVQTSPRDAAVGVTAPITLAWQEAAGAGTYDLSLGPSNPPPLHQAGLVGTTATATSLLPATTYFWSVTAHAACDPSKTSATAVRSFTTAGVCEEAGAFGLTAPADGAVDVASSTALSWTESANASAYDLYLGTIEPPPPYLLDLPRPSASVSGLLQGRRYFWRVVAKVACDQAKAVSSPVSRFTVAGTCVAPGPTSITFVPPGNVGVGQTYVIAWSAAPGLDAGGGYVVERSLSASFTPVLDTQATLATFASFVGATPGAYHHRVRAVAGCDPSRQGPVSDPRTVTVAAGAPNVVFTVQPRAVITALGEKLEDSRATLVVENLGTAPIGVIVGRQEIESVPFFRITDPLGGSSSFLTLEPRRPKALEVQFSGPPNDVAGSYQGIVFLAATGQGLAITPYAFVSLKVGGAQTATPVFSRDGTPSEYAFFPGLTGDDATRPPITVDIHNPGSEPMELGAEVGPEAWLIPEKGWNLSPIPPGGSRTVRLFTQRSLAPNGSALPRYTYFTVRTRSGQTARLLVQDNDAPSVGPGRGSGLDREARSYVLPSVVKATSAIGNAFVSRLSLSNAGNEAVQADLVFTPAGADGFDGGQVRRATVLVPANDVVSLTDPLVQLFGLTPPVSGALEVRAAPGRAGLLTVASSVEAPARDGGTFGFQMPAVVRGTGAKQGEPHVLAGITAGEAYRTNLILTETTGADRAVVRAVLYDSEGSRKGDTVLEVPRYGQRQLSGVVPALGGGDSLEAGRIELTVEAGTGAVVGVVTVIDNTNDDAVVYVSRATVDSSASGSARTRRPQWARASGTMKLVVPAVVNGFPTFPSATLPYTFRSLMGFTSGTLAPATFQLRYDDLETGATHRKTVTVDGRRTLEFKNVLEDLFGLSPGAKSQGPVFIEADANGVVYCKVYSQLAKGTLGDGFPVLPIPYEAMTGSSGVTPVYLDGLEQSTDAARGTRSNLILNEVTGQPVTVTVRLYEAGNRSRPIGERTFKLAPLEKRQLSTIFRELDLDGEERRKDRTNVQCVVTAQGAGLVSAVVTTIDNKTGDTRNSVLTPTGGTSVPAGPGIGR